MTTICFTAKIFKIGSWLLLRLPERASARLPSRGMAMVQGTLNGLSFKTPLEPDGRGSHWCRVSETLEVKEGDTVSLEIEPMKEWPEPSLPDDLRNALTSSAKAHDAWIDITPMARWDWIRWIHGTKQAETRKKRIATTCDMLKSGKRRPCCFNRNLCTETYVSNNGILSCAGCETAEI